MGWSVPPKFSLLKWLRQKSVANEEHQNFVCQDFAYRLHILKDALNVVDRETGIYPIWLCPMRHVVPDQIKHLSWFKKEDVHVDVGIYG